MRVDDVRKTVTVLFCDVEGSTTLGDRLDPETLRQVMVRFFEEMRAVIERHGGSVEKYIGDAVMAVFGIPRLHEDDALRAVRAAEEMQRALGSVNEELRSRWGVELRTRIGVNTGEVVVGDTSAGQSLVLGDAVNVAARLEQAAPVGQVFLGAETLALVRGQVQVEDVGPLELKGKPGVVHAYRLRTASPPAALEARPETPFIGREHELETLRSALARCIHEGRGVLVTVFGPPGVGKSRLSRRFAEELGPQARLLSGRCPPYGDGGTFWPIAELVRQAVGATGSGLAHGIEAAVRGAEDAELISERLLGALGIEGRTSTLQDAFWAVRRFLEQLGAGRPIVVVLDDLQWADPTVLDLVEYLAGWTRETPLLLVALARPELLDARPTWGSGSASITLRPFDDEESRRLLGSLLPDPDVDPQVAERVAESAGGNALFLEEMVRMLEDEGVVRPSGNLRAAPTLPIPASIHALLGARLDRLSSEERTVIRSAAVIGREFSWGSVAELVPQDIRTEVGAHLQALVRKDLIRPGRSMFAGEDGFRFHHVLLQETAYRTTPKETRADLHARFGRWIVDAARDQGELDELVGFHLERAIAYRSELGASNDELRPLEVRAATALARAGDRALARRDMRAAADLLGRALRLVPPAESDRLRILLGLGEALAETGELDRAASSLREAARLAGEAGDDPAAAKAAVLELDLLQSTDPKSLGDAEQRATAAITTLERAADDAGLARAWRLVADLHWARARYGSADQALVRAIEHARRAGDAREEAECLGRYVGSGAYGPAHVSEVERRCEELLASRGGIAGREAPAYRALAIVRAMQGRFDEARALAARARAVHEEFGFALRAPWVAETVAMIEALAGDLEAAEQALRAGFDAAAELGEQGFQATAAGLLARVLAERGDLEAAERFAESARRLAAEDDVVTQVLWRMARARTVAVTGSAGGEAEALGAEALALAEATDDVTMQGDVLVDLAAIRGAGGAREALDAAIALYEAKGNAAAAEAARRRRAGLPAS